MRQVMAIRLQVQLGAMVNCMHKRTIPLQALGMAMRRVSVNDVPEAMAD